MTDIPNDIIEMARKLATSFAREIIDAEARGAAKERERCARLVDEVAERHRVATINCTAEGQRDAARFASYAARATDDIATAIREAKP